MIEEFAKAIGVAFGLKHEGRDADALNELRQAYKTWFSLDADSFAVMSAVEFLHLVTKEKEFSNQQVKALADGLKAEAEMLDADSVIERKDRLTKALALVEYLEATDTSTFDPSRITDIRSLKEKIAAI